MGFPRQLDKGKGELLISPLPLSSICPEPIVRSGRNGRRRCGYLRQMGRLKDKSHAGDQGDRDFGREAPGRVRKDAQGVGRDLRSSQVALRCSVKRLYERVRRRGRTIWRGRGPHYPAGTVRPAAIIFGVALRPAVSLVVRRARPEQLPRHARRQWPSGDRSRRVGVVAIGNALRLRYVTFIGGVRRTLAITVVMPMVVAVIMVTTSSKGESQWSRNENCGKNRC